MDVQSTPRPKPGLECTFGQPRVTMELTSALASGLPGVPGEVKRRRSEATTEIEALEAERHERYECAYGSWLASLAVGRTSVDDFACLFAEAFLPAQTINPLDHTAPSEVKEDVMPPLPTVAEGLWDNVPCKCCQNDGWYWRHFCCHCGKDEI